jgi:hypothetical protein
MDRTCNQEELEDPQSLLLLQTQSQLTMAVQTITTLPPATAADAEPPYYIMPLRKAADREAANTTIDGVVTDPDPPVPGYVPVNGDAIGPEPPLNGTGLDDMDKDYITDSNYGPGFVDQPIAEAPGIAPEKAARDLSLILFGVVFFLVFLAYVLHLTPAITQASMWCIMNKMVAAFIVGLCIAGYRDTTDYLTSSSFFANYYLAGAFIRFGTVVLLLEFLFFSCHSCAVEDDSLRAVETLGSYALGFAAIDAFGGLQQLDGSEIAGVDFSTSPGAALVAAGVAVLLLGAGMHIMSAVRKKSSHESRFEKTGMLDSNNESDDEAFAMCIGFLLSQVAIFCITSSLFPVDGMKAISDTSQIPLWPFMRILCGLSCWLVFASCIWSFERLKSLHDFQTYHRTEIMAVRLISMFLAWCCIRLGELIFRSSSQAWLGSGDAVMDHLSFALFSSVSVLLFVVLGTILVPGSLEKGTPDYYVLSSAVGLIAAVPWVQFCYVVSEPFGVSIYAPEGDVRQLALAQLTQAAGSKHPERPASGGVDSLGQAVLLIVFAVLVSIPWKLYILPRSARKRTNIVVAGLRAVEHAAERALGRTS